MSYKMGERGQATLFPKMLEDYVGEEDPVRAYDAFIEALDFGRSWPRRAEGKQESGFMPLDSGYFCLRKNSGMTSYLWDTTLEQ